MCTFLHIELPNKVALVRDTRNHLRGYRLEDRVDNLRFAKKGRYTQVTDV
jgi:hypothetical protein